MGGEHKPSGLIKQSFGILKVLIAPASVFSDLEESPSWGTAFALLYICSIAIGWFMIPAIEQPMRHVFEESFSQGGADKAAASITRYLFTVEIGLEPLWKSLRWIILAAFFHLFSLALDAPKRFSFKHFFSVIVYSETILILFSAINLFLVYINGLGRVTGPADLRILKGLEVIMGANNQNEALRTFLENVNVSAIWYLAVLTIGVCVITGLRKSEAAFIAVASWLLTIALDMAKPMVSQSLANAVT